MKTTTKTTSALAAVAIVGSFATSTAQAEEVKEVTTETAPVVAESTAKEITKADLDSAKASVDTAKADVDAKTAAVAHAQETVASAESEVAASQAKVATAENAPEEIAKVTERIEAKTSEKANLEGQVADAQAKVADASAKESEARTAQVQADVTVAEATEAVKAAEAAVPSTSVDGAIATKEAEKTALTNEKATTENQVASTTKAVEDKVVEIANYQPKVTEEVKHTTDDKNETIHVKTEDAQWDIDSGFAWYGEPVKHADGHTTVTHEVLSEDYVPNVAKVAEYLAAYINDLKRLNHLPGTAVVNIDPNAMAYSAKRAYEASQTDLSHETDDKTYKGLENLASLTLKKKNSKFMSDQQLAYQLAYAWFNEYNNHRYQDFGHRQNLLATNTFSLGIFVDTSEHAFNKYYVSFNAQDTDRKTYVSMKTITNETGQKIHRFRDQADYEAAGIPLTTGHPGSDQPLVFLPKTTFKYVTRTVEDKTPELQAELVLLEAEKAQAIAKDTQVATQLTQVTADLTALKAEQANLAADKADKVAKLAEAKATLDTAKAQQVTANLAYTESKANADKAKTDLAALEAEISSVESEIDTLKEQKSEIESLASKVAELKAAVVAAEAKVAEAKSAEVVAERELTEAEGTLADARKAYETLARDYELQEMLKPKPETPKVDEPKVDKPKSNVLQMDIPPIDEAPKAVNHEAIQNLIKADKAKAISGTTETKTLSRVEKYHQLPKTSSASSSVLQAVGVGLAALGLVGYRQKRKSRYVMNR
ncbi:LPXTG cell wall anchor domain-containing protein [Streptococcus acidominimus]|uniref:LPXTG cell wall anchor domain-containing protein n=1 Tax=Streptococcus acidominimus TaxID=1326 RepID=A0A4Y9FK66_STRAI|nr:LPXTG cell wall anchor domain-containing protein [Streptococcus acidominimus]MBF0819676.1 LPXTG cell wall anchor domain-containing protein [Streptococcus acidominimus]MBF0838473.1 LPXTG cell wall anchor domain-containing protein [Streptococcus acidominimus]MBF0847303.1 LPXTG cell wall anchor domain-containing protein [Streptococcus danieliae]TFU29587.1 LPXTG cell wall anchor domain-containing protein [Streptococcus acidominimus]